MKSKSNINLIIFGANVKKYRVMKKYTQEQLSDIIGISSVQVGRIESGKNACTIEILVRLCCALDCTPNDLFKDIKEVSLKDSDSMSLSNRLNNDNYKDEDTQKLLKHILNFFETK